jgi:REP element-mobilizing transposase RayT
MPRTYAKNLVHCVYSTKNRAPSIKNPGRIWQITREIARNIDIDIIAIGGVSDHIHFLMSLPPSRAMANIVRDLKANSSLILRNDNKSFHWQDGYAVISVSPAAVPAVIRYIENQERQHRNCRFEDEYLAMLDRAGITYDSKYVLD